MAQQSLYFPKFPVFSPPNFSTWCDGVFSAVSLSGLSLWDRQIIVPRISRTLDCLILSDDHPRWSIIDVPGARIKTFDPFESVIPLCGSRKKTFTCSALVQVESLSVRTWINKKKFSCCCDSRSYCVRRIVWYTGKLSNRFRLQVYERLLYARSDSMGRVYERTQTHSIDSLSVADQSSVVHEASE